MLLNNSLYSSVVNTLFANEIKSKRIFNVPLSMHNPDNWETEFGTVSWKDYDGIILDAFHEAPEEWRVSKVYKMAIDAGVPANRIIWIDSGFNPNAGIKHISIPMFMYSYSVEQVVVPLVPKREKLFLALARDPKIQRVKFILKLLENNIDKSAVITCGSSVDYQAGWDNLIPDDNVYKNRFPILLNSKKASIQEVNSIEPEFKKCLFNIVLETGFEYIGPNSGWDRHFYTEKTGKAFFLEQIPLFLSKKGYVAVLRNLGFDMFDDIVNHSYDLIEDPNDRIDALVAECLRLSNIGINHFKSLSGLQERFHYNKLQRRVVADKLHTQSTDQLKTWLNSL